MTRLGFHHLSGARSPKCRDGGCVEAGTQSGGLCVGRLRRPDPFPNQHPIGGGTTNVD